MHSRFISSLVGLALLALTSCGTPEESETRPQGTNVLSEPALRQALAGQVDFVSHIKPILEAKCAACHNRQALPGKISLASREEALRTGTLRGFILPGQPEASPFLTRIGTAHAAVQAMPPVGESLTQEETRLLKRWIAQGAVWPAGSAGTLRTSPH